MTALDKIIEIDHKKAQELMERCGGIIENLEIKVDMLSLSAHIDECDKCKKKWKQIKKQRK